MVRKIKDKFQIDPFLVFYLIHASQVGVGVLGFQRLIMKEAGHDAWITVLITGVVYHFLIIMMYKMMNTYEMDFVHIQKTIFGKSVGTLLNCAFIVLTLVTAFTVIRTYIEVVQVWMFPHLSSWVLGAVFCFVIYYAVSGGFKVVTGICYFGVIVPLFLVIFLIFPLRYANFENLLPLFQAPVTDIFSAINNMTLTYFGMEMLFIYYPFIKNARKSQKFAHLGLALTTIIYLIITVVTFAFYSEKQLEKTVWATLSMFKVAEFSFIERFEYVAVAFWVVVVIPNMVLYLWASSRAAKEVFHVSQRKSLIAFLVLIFLSICLIDSRILVSKINTMLGEAAFYFILLYVPALFTVAMLYYKKYRRKIT